LLQWTIAKTHPAQLEVPVSRNPLLVFAQPISNGLETTVKVLISFVLLSFLLFVFFFLFFFLPFFSFFSPFSLETRTDTLTNRIRGLPFRSLSEWRNMYQPRRRRIPLPVPRWLRWFEMRHPKLIPFWQRPRSTGRRNGNKIKKKIK